MNKIIVGKIQLRPHPESENLMIGQIDGHQVVVGNHYDEGVLGFFIPDGAFVPDHLAEEMWVKGKLAGNQKNRVKSRLMKGVQSEGLFYGSQYWIKANGLKGYIKSASWNPTWVEGQDITKEVGITFDGN